MDRLEEIRKRDEYTILADIYNRSHFLACSDRRWLLGEVERLQQRVEKAESDVDTWRWEFGAALKRAEALDETSQIMKKNYDENIEELRAEIKEARRALAGEFTGKIETVKLYPKALTPEETSNDSDDLDDLNEWQLFDDE